MISAKKELIELAQILSLKDLSLVTSGDELSISGVVVSKDPMSFKDFLFAYCYLSEKEIYKVSTELRNFILVAKIENGDITYRGQKVNLSYIIEK